MEGFLLSSHCLKLEIAYWDNERTDMTGRIVRKKEAMERLGVLSYATFNNLLDLPGAPKPVVGKMYDYNALEKFLDKMNGIQEPETEKDWDAEFAKGLEKLGKNKNEIPAR